MKRTDKETLEWLLSNQPRNAVAINAVRATLGLGTNYRAPEQPKKPIRRRPIILYGYNTCK